MGSAAFLIFASPGGLSMPIPVPDAGSPDRGLPPPVAVIVWGVVSMEGKISYPGVAAAVAGVVGLLGVYADWWETADGVYAGTADVSGSLAFAMSLGLFVFGAASVLMSDLRIRRAMSVLFTLCAVVLALAGLWGITRADQVAPGAEVASGLWISVLAGALGIAAGVLAMRDVRAPERAEAAGSS